MMNNQDTICAIATAQGGAIGIIRVSGSDAVNITDTIFKPIGNDKSPLSQRKPYTITFGHIVDTDGSVVDEVLVSVFRAPHSYTGEDSTEISCHGSAYILQKTMQLLIGAGCRSALPGEYTQRAFLNGKMDLSQAEAVADLIASSSEATHRMAMNQMRGSFSRELSRLREELLHLTSLMELELDFSDHEELEFADRTELSAISAQVENIIDKLVKSFSLGNALKSGIPVAIIGETNVGKSTLLNVLVGEDKAIVSDIHGTTRDIIEDTINIDGTVFRFIDTAGIRETDDTIENLGIERTFLKLSQAEIVLWMIDATQAEKQISELAANLLPRCKDKTLIVTINKSDLTESSSSNESEIKACLTNALTYLYNDDTMSPDSIKNMHVVSISAKSNINIDTLRRLLLSSSALPDYSSNDVIVNNLRHYNALKSALEAIHRVQDGIATNLPSDLISQDLRECLHYLGEITGGEISSQETLNNIFSHFCVGK